MRLLGRLIISIVRSQFFHQAPLPKFFVFRLWRSIFRQFCDFSPRELFEQLLYLRLIPIRLMAGILIAIHTSRTSSFAFHCLPAAYSGYFRRLPLWRILSTFWNMMNVIGHLIVFVHVCWVNLRDVLLHGVSLRLELGDEWRGAYVLRMFGFVFASAAFKWSSNLSGLRRCGHRRLNLFRIRGINTLQLFPIIRLKDLSGSMLLVCARRSICCVRSSRTRCLARFNMYLLWIYSRLHRNFVSPERSKMDSIQFLGRELAFIDFVLLFSSLLCIDTTRPLIYLHPVLWLAS